MGQDDGAPMRVRWARLRLQIIGTLLASPPPDGELATRIAELAARTWKHATQGGTVQYSAKTIERWYYTARGEQDPFRALERKVPRHAGTHPAIGDPLAEALRGAASRPSSMEPEILVVDRLDAALDALVLSLTLEHPSLEAVDDPSIAAPPTLRRAHRLVRLARRLRDDLDRHRLAVDSALKDDRGEDLPF